MDAHRYRFHVEALTCNEVPDRKSARSFEVASHDYVLAIVRRVNAANAFDRNEATALTVGLKLFTGVMLRYRHDPLFAEVRPAMRVFIGNLKARIASSTSAGPSH
jgi:hypothetical protein